MCYQTSPLLFFMNSTALTTCHDLNEKNSIASNAQIIFTISSQCHGSEKKAPPSFFRAGYQKQSELEFLPVSAIIFLQLEWLSSISSIFSNSWIDLKRLITFHQNLSIMVYVYDISIYENIPLISLKMMQKSTSAQIHCRTRNTKSQTSRYGYGRKLFTFGVTNTPKQIVEHS